MVIIQDKNDFSKKFYNKLSSYRLVDKCKREKFPLENEGLETIKLKVAIKLVDELDTD